MAKCRECFTRARRPEEVAQRREEIVLHGSGMIGFGEYPKEGDVATVRYECK